ncbi:TRAP transporter substrate-binding protein [Paenibacillus silviterrae]|uniref:TRAP transporter substrate-binding protein n=1 Tax=Paenibacillus silviterrae TaxID=3242194 RepID=UPI0025437A69|nr:TRAP transporter substrate-binding protein [Paenibacillus chinjuensis]
MRPWAGTLVFVLLGLTAALFIGFYPAFTWGSVPQDDEQQGYGNELIIKFSHVVAENTPKGLAAQRFADLVKEKTGKRVKVEIYPNGVLYAEAGEVEALMRGEIQMIAPSTSHLSEHVPSWLVMDLPYAFLSQEAVKEAMEGPIGQQLFSRLEKKNMIGLAYWGNGFKQMTSNRGPLRQPSDFQDQRFRIIPSRVIEEQFKLLGVKSVPMPFNNVYRGLETGLVDGGENTISNIYTKKFYQVQRFMTLSNHGYLGYAVLMNKKFWAQIPPELQRGIREAMAETSAWANENAIRMNERQWNDIKASGSVEIHTLTPQERTEWRKAWEPLYDQFEREIGRELIGEIRKLQDKYEEH